MPWSLYYTGTMLGARFRQPLGIFNLLRWSIKTLFRGRSRRGRQRFLIRVANFIFEMSLNIENLRGIDLRAENN